MMISLASIFDQNVWSVLPEPLIQEWTNQHRTLDQKLKDGIVQLKAENSSIKEEKTQLDAKVKALTEENEKLKMELAAGPWSVVNNMELLLKGLETRLNANAVKQETTLRQSNTTVVESINKNSKTRQDSTRQYKTALLHPSRLSRHTQKILSKGSKRFIVCKL
jgi:hypothetical protein